MLTNATKCYSLDEKNAKTFYCETCDFRTPKLSNFEKHLSTDKHKNATNDTNMLQNDTKCYQVAEKRCQKEPVTFFCKFCNYYTPKQGNFQKHLETEKHNNNKLLLSATKVVESSTKNDVNYYCNYCDYHTPKYSNYVKHCETDKHKIYRSSKVANAKNADKSFSVKPSQSDTYCPVVEENIETKLFENVKETNSFQCECGKIFKQRTSLARHKKSCSSHGFNKNTLCKCSCGCEFNSMDLFNEHQKTCNYLVQKLLEQNTALIQTQGVSNSHNNTMTNSHNNSHNKTFNLNFFLNETCKDAMNITDFVNSLKLTIQDLENVGQVGYSEGISQMFVKGLNDLEVEKRPIHCSDLKREVIHIKDQDKWEQDTANRDKLKQAIKDLSTKNLMLMDDWQKLHPGCKDPDNSKNDLYLKMMVESLGPADEVAERKDMGKIIRSIAKTTIIKKSELK